jgi:DNA-binding NarL/FixJ family response regulator
MPVKIFLIEGREIVREGIRSMLDSANNLLLIGTAADDTEAYEKLATIRPDVILMDMNMPVKTVLEFTKGIKEKYPETRVLVLIMHEYESSLVKLLEGGVDGYVPKNTSKEELIAAIKKVNADGTYVQPDTISDILTKYKFSSGVPDKPAMDLSERERQVLDLIAVGLTNVEMAKKLFTSVRTIETRRKKLLDKTGTINTATLIRYAVLNGLIK